MKLKTLIPVGIILAFVALAATACGGKKATTSAMCALVVGDGASGHDSKVHKVYYPNSKISYSSDSEKVEYFPCNSRNFIINDGTQVNANNQKVGDRFTRTPASTSTGTHILVASRSFWTLNENRNVLANYFWPVCLKYNCASTSPTSGSANFSTPGWNGMLGENMGPSIDKAIQIAAYTMSDEIWQKTNPAKYIELGKKASAIFAAQVQAVTGYNVDLFCGSGNSVWPNPNKPGKGTFNCQPIRIVIDDVQPAPVKKGSGTASASAKALNAELLKAAEAKYGPDAGMWLGLQDTVGQCPSKSTCVFNIGGSGGSTIALPSPAPATIRKK